MTASLLEIGLPTEADTLKLARALARLLKPGDVVLLEGEIGAGKTSLARGIIRAFVGEDEDVPSPTFTLIQIYEADSATIWHADLYRLGDMQEIVELGLLDAFSDAICLIEWPDRLAEMRPGNALTLSMKAGRDGHHCTVIGPQIWADRLSMLHA